MAAAGLPLPNKHEALLAEMLFAQMLCVPKPPLKPLAYSTLMVGLQNPMPQVLTPILLRWLYCKQCALLVILRPCLCLHLLLHSMTS